MARKPKISVRKLLKARLRGDTRLSLSFQLYGPEIPGWEMLKKKVRPIRKNMRLSTYVWAPVGDDGGKRLKMEVTEMPSQDETLDGVQLTLDHSMATHLMGPGAAYGVDFGDGAIINTQQAEAGAVLDFLVYPSANLAARFSSIGSTPISMVEFAAGVEAFFKQGQDNTDGESALEIEVEVDRGRMSVGDTTELRFRRPADAPDNSNWWWFLLNTGHCKLYRDEEDRVFFTPARLGKVDILCVNFDRELGRSVAKTSIVVLP